MKITIPSKVLAVCIAEMNPNSPVINFGSLYVGIELLSQDKASSWRDRDSNKEKVRNWDRMG